MPMVTNMLYGGPFRDMRLLQEEVNRLAQSAAAPQATFPAINVYAHQDGIVITAELPGVQQDDLEITVHRDTVTLRGERQDKSDDAGAYHRRERGSGTFVRTFGLPFQVDPVNRLWNGTPDRLPIGTPVKAVITPAELVRVARPG